VEEQKSVGDQTGDESESCKETLQILPDECENKPEHVHSKLTNEQEIQNGLPVADDDNLVTGDIRDAEVSASDANGSCIEVSTKPDSGSPISTIHNTEDSEGAVEEEADKVGVQGTIDCVPSEGVSISEQDTVSASLHVSKDEKSLATEDDVHATQSVETEGQDFVDAPSPMDVDTPGLPVIGMIRRVSNQDVESEMECMQDDAVQNLDSWQTESLSGDAGEPMLVEEDAAAVNTDERAHQDLDAPAHVSVALNEERGCEPGDSVRVTEAEGELDVAEEDTRISGDVPNITKDAAEVNNSALCEFSSQETSEISSEEALESPSVEIPQHPEGVDDIIRQLNTDTGEGVDEVDACVAPKADGQTVEAESKSNTAAHYEKSEEEADNGDLMEGDDFTVELQPEDVENTAVQELNESSQTAEGETMTADSEKVDNEEPVKNTSTENEAEESKDCVLAEDGTKSQSPENTLPDKV
jgi:hypothetical protein